MRDVTTELKELRLHGMAGVWDELTSHEGVPTDVGIQTSRWLIEHLLQPVQGDERSPGDGLHWEYL